MRYANTNACTIIESSLLRFGLVLHLNGESWSSGREEWVNKKLCGSVCGREFAVVRTMRWVRNRISIRNLNKNAIKTDTAGRNFFNQITRFIERTIATAAHIIFVCKLTIARVSVCACVWVRVWQNSFLLPFSLLFLFSLFSIGLIYLWPQHQSAVLCGEQWTCDAVCPTDKIIFLYLLFVFAWAKCTTALAHTHTRHVAGVYLFKRKLMLIIVAFAYLLFLHFICSLGWRRRNERLIHTY